VRRRFVTLLELLIAMGLVSILLTVLMGIYSQTVKTQHSIERSLQSNFQLLYAQFRLNQVIPTILNPADDKDNQGWAFYTQSPHSLVFTYDNGAGSGSLFSNEVIGRLFVDQQNRLMLLTWPVPKRYADVDPPMRVEVLLENVSGLTFDFYKPEPSETKQQKISPERKTGEYGSGFTTWSPQEKDLPALMRIIVTCEGDKKPVLYAFVLTHSSTPVSYP